MDSARTWFQKLQTKEKIASKKNELGLHGMDGTEETPSDATKQRVAAAKQYIENHYKEQMKNLQERRERYGLKRKKLLSSPLLLLLLFCFLLSFVSIMELNKYIFS